MHAASNSERSVQRSSRLIERRRVRMSAVHWTLQELLQLVAAVAVSVKLAVSGSPLLACSFLVFVLSTRTAIVDYSLVGSAATSLALITTILLVVCGAFQFFSG